MWCKAIFALLWAALTLNTSALAVGKKPGDLVKPYRRAPLQDIVTWDKDSIFVRGERVILFSGEFHPFRLPVPSLWLDVFQKLKSAGFTCVSFYVDWALLEGKPGEFLSEGVLAWEKFFEAASEAGIYLIARPGPYINAEVSGGGFPGWLARDKAIERTPDYVPLTENYVKNIGEIVAKAQITNGGPVILLQPENEYSLGASNVVFPDKDYFQLVEDQYRAAGIVVPFISNDAWPAGYFTPGSGKGEVDIYGHDGYPLGFDCANPERWPDNALPTSWLNSHFNQSASTPYAVAEFQGGAFDPWGGRGFEACASLLNEKFERVFYKNLYGMQIAIFNIYMTYGGTNWGNLGHPGGYTSYDYGAMVAEDRTVSRTKYSEVKLQANFLKASPAYLVGNATNTVNGSIHVNTPDIATTRVTTNSTNFYVIRHSAYNSLKSTQYKLYVPSSAGNLTIPQSNGTLTLNGRDSKIHVVDYDVGGINLLYSSAEVFTWKKYDDKTVLVLYGGDDEFHEAAFVGQRAPTVVEGSGVTTTNKNGTIVLSWPVTSERKVVKFPSGLFVYLLNRNDAYNYWVLDLPSAAPTNNFFSPSTKSVIVRAGYLLRTASISGSTLALTGDINSTTTIEVVGGAPADGALTFNGAPVTTSTNSYGVISGSVAFNEPKLSIPSLKDLTWKSIDSLPEAQSSYDDSAWVKASNTYSNNTIRNITTPTSLYSFDYGFHTGNLLYRGHFTATGNESEISIETWGGSGFAAAVYLNGSQIDDGGAWPGSGIYSTYVQNITLPKLTAGQPYVFTVVTDNMGIEEDWTTGTDQNKFPRGVVDYNITGASKDAITWKLTGNLGGEDYIDKTRGPLNEGGLFAERQGYHLPAPPTSDWTTSSPFDGTTAPGINFYTASFDLDIPEGYDVPLHFVFANTTQGTANYRAQLYVNGYQFGKYANNVGPQTSFPVPQGILDYQGTNYIALSLWSFDEGGNKLSGLEIVPKAVIQSGFGKVGNSPAPKWVKRDGAY